MRTIHVEKILETIATKYEPFSQEVDFQYRFADEILEQYPGSHVFLECLPYPSASSVRVDICVIYGDKRYLFELKYKVRNQAVDLSCYDYVKDIRKIEKLNGMSKDFSGFAIFLTNRSIFWRGSDNTTSNYYPFQLKDGNELKGTLDWQGNREKKGEGRQDPIQLDGRYRLKWTDYCKAPIQRCKKGNQKLRYLIVSI
ncbi:MAG: hypothetical protein KGD60_06745 [Candidatus Thorarchaeota archaeon]|nr:hypothetical protein [Candidatus Thorarchaeota archaeon]